MVAFQSLTNAIVLALCYASVASALELRPSHLKKRDGTPLPGFTRKSKYLTYGSGMAQPATFATQTVGDAAKSFVTRELSLKTEDVTVKSSDTKEDVKTAYLSQQHNGIPFANAVANVAIKDSKVVAFGHSFVNSTSIASADPTVSKEDAIKAAEEALDGTYNGIPTTLEYFALDDGTVALTHAVQVRNAEQKTWYEGFIDAHSGKLVGVVDFRADASYHVVPIENQDPTQGLKVVVDPADTKASPWGWHSINGGEPSTDTSGNNVIAYFDSDRLDRTKQSADGQVFNYTFDATAEPSTYLDFARTNAFYIVNTVHDITYRYGFDSFNFQQSTSDGSGGKGNDAIVVSVHNSSGLNNAAMYTPADGIAGEILMFLWDETSPMRDGSIENDILVHEATHGTTNRMTGGGTGRCLQIAESQGLGEGWSDAFAEWTEQTNGTVSDFTVGGYVINDPAGIRSHPYSTDKNVNPYTYNTLLSLGEVHDVGEVWANMLHNVYAALVAEHGWSATAKTDPTGTEGNVVYMHLFLDALKLQPCQPEFPTARNAWIQADQNRYGGANKCLLWKAFASRGLGPSAGETYQDDFSVPEECQ